MKKKIIFTVILLISIGTCVYREGDSQGAVENFSSERFLLGAEGEGGYISSITLKAFVEEIRTIDPDKCRKYEELLRRGESEYYLTAEQLCELYYYRKSESERKEFVENVKGQKISVQIADPYTTMISYNE